MRYNVITNNTTREKRNFLINLKYGIPVIMNIQ